MEDGFIRPTKTVKYRHSLRGFQLGFEGLMQPA